MRARTGRPSPRAALVALVAGVLAGCVTLTPKQQETLEDVRRFADATTAAYNVPRIRVNVEPGTNLGIGGRYRQGNFYINVGMLNSRNLNSLVAHELAHYVLGHDMPVAGASMAEFQLAQELRELDANAKAVEILMRVKGMSEKDAVGTVVTHLRGAQRAVERGGPITPGHRTPAAEIADLLARYPGTTPD
jgi:hypothetical protein